MANRSILTATDLAAFAAIHGAANAGLPCPSNDDILAITGHASPASVTALLSKLQRHGLITVERFTNSRRVTIVETGRQTAAVPGRPRTKHTSANHQASMAAYSARKQAERRQAEEEHRLSVLAASSADREPCFRCGVRADVGCRHNPLTSSPHPAAGSPAAVLPSAAAGAPVASLFHGDRYAD